MESLEILERIISKGGVMGACAKRYVYNKEQSDQFIKECYDQCHNTSAVHLWGEELITDIQNYIQKIQDHKNTLKRNYGLAK